MLVREKAEDKWFAALVDDALSIQGRFATWNDFLAFLRTQNALVDVWSYGEGGLGPPGAFRPRSSGN